MKTRILRIAPVELYEIVADAPGERHYLVRSRDRLRSVLVCFTGQSDEPDLGLICHLGAQAIIQRTAAEILARQPA